MTLPPLLRGGCPALPEAITIFMNVKLTCLRENSDGSVGRESVAPPADPFSRRNAPHDSKAAE
jgi:hypothetical protein